MRVVFAVPGANDAPSRARSSDLYLSLVDRFDRLRDGQVYDDAGANTLCSCVWRGELFDQGAGDVADGDVGFLDALGVG
jgi:hypothetical protein